MFEASDELEQKKITEASTSNMHKCLLINANNTFTEASTSNQQHAQRIGRRMIMLGQYACCITRRQKPKIYSTCTGANMQEAP
jgi:hypothetical protein